MKMLKCKCKHDQDMHADTYSGECLGDCFASDDGMIKCPCKKFRKR